MLLLDLLDVDETEDLLLPLELLELGLELDELVLLELRELGGGGGLVGLNGPV